MGSANNNIRDQLELKHYGWDSYFKNTLDSDKNKFNPGRVILQHRNKYKIVSENGEIWARAAGNLFYSNKDDSGLPAIGDWVTFELQGNKDLGLIKSILPRKTKISRKVAGLTSKEQIIAANIDLVFIVSALDREFNLRRLERYQIIVKENGITPVFVLNKLDIGTDIEGKYDQLKNIAGKVKIIKICALQKTGFNQLDPFLKKAKTVTFVGSSGVGKSTIINGLIGEDILKVDTLDNKNKGKHTTSRKELILLKTGCMVIDTPGMRELQLIDSAEGIEKTFEDILSLAENCHFRDCKHLNEPKCAVKSAIDAGEIDIKRLLNYHKIIKEIDSFQKFKTQTKNYTVKEKKLLNKKRNLQK